MNFIYIDLFLVLSFLWIDTSGNYSADSVEIINTSGQIDTLSLNTSITADTSIDIIDTLTQTIDFEDDSLRQYQGDSLTKIDTLINAIDLKPDTFSIAMTGDVMLGTNFPSPNYLPPGNNCYPLLDSIKHFIQDADIGFCNLEGGFAGESGNAKNCKDPKTCYVFRMPDEYVNCLVDAGFDLVSTANNHVNDFGYAGKVNTVKVLEQAGLHFAGFIDHPHTIFKQNGIIIGFCAFSPNRGVMDLRNMDQAESIVHLLSDTCDIVIVSMHGGAEGFEHQHVTRQSEIFLGADRGNVYEFSHRMIDAGADIIIGHGPHVTRAMEIYNDRFIAYSLGNFATYSRFNISGPNGIAPLVKLTVDSNGKFLGGKIIPVFQSGEGGTRFDPNKRVIFKLQDLIRTDFPDNMLNIDNEGNINP